MEQTTTLKLSSDGTEVQILFADGKESIFFTTKEEVANALNVLHQTKRITDDEHIKLLAELQGFRSLPAKEHDVQLIGIAIPMFELLRDLKEIHDMPDEEVNEAFFKQCDCGRKHGRIYIRSGMTDDFSNPEEGDQLLKQMRESNVITDEEMKKVRKEMYAVLGEPEKVSV